MRISSWHPIRINYKQFFKRLDKVNSTYKTTESQYALP